MPNDPPDDGRTSYDEDCSHAQVQHQNDIDMLPRVTAPSQGPTQLVAPQPVDARPSPIIRPSSDSSDRSPRRRSPLISDGRDVSRASPLLQKAKAADDQKENPENKESNDETRATTKPRTRVGTRLSRGEGSVLPVQGADEESTLAREKLERMRRNKESKRRWKIRTGTQAVKLALTAGGKGRADERPIEETESAESMDLSRAYGEVRLAISSLPDYPVLAVRGARERARTALTRKATSKISGDSFEARSTTEPKLSKGHQSLVRKLTAPRRNSLNASAKEDASPPTPTASSCAPVTAAMTDAISPTRTSLAGPQHWELDDVEEEKVVEERSEGAIHDLTKPKDAFSIGPSQAKGTKPAVSNIITSNHGQANYSDRLRVMVQSPSDAEHLLPPPTFLHPTGAEESRSDQRKDIEEDGTGRIARQKRNSANEGTMASDVSSTSEVNSSNSDWPGGGQLSEDEVDDESENHDVEEDEDGDDVEKDEGDLDDSESESLSGDEEPAMSDDRLVAMLNLEHGEQLSKQAKKRARKLKKAARRKEIRRSRGKMLTSTEAESADSDAAGSLPKALRKSTLGNRVSSGLHYATSQSRNRRAMERYSPHPVGNEIHAIIRSPPRSAGVSQTNVVDQGRGSSKSSLNLPSMSNANANAVMSTAGASISRASTPGHVKESRPESISETIEDIKANGNSDIMAPSPLVDGDESIASPLSGIDAGDFSKNLLQRWNTAMSSSSQGSRAGTMRSRILNLRRHHRKPSDLAEASGASTPKDDEADAERELDKMLGKLVAEQEPEQLQELYEYDVLYENQRGLLVFGIPKFTPRMLFQWDPAPWVNARYGDSVYNIVNAQLPDPSWEWVHPEWLIDMSGDVDESGWQYAHNFGNLTVPLFWRPNEVMPRANVAGNGEMNRRFARHMEREANRVDDGLEALVRSARVTSYKWTGEATQNTYVRRRRWIRLRRRKKTAVQTPAPTPPVERTQDKSMASEDWARITESHDATEKTGKAGLSSDLHASSSSSASSSSGSTSYFEEDGNTESDEFFASPNANESTFLPRKLARNLRNGPDPAIMRRSREESRRRRRAREFTGTIRELKSLLPAILDPAGRHGSQPQQTASERVSLTNGFSAMTKEDERRMWLGQVDARNPFISWKTVKRRLEDDDMAFAGTFIRAKDRKFAQRKHEKAKKRASRKTLLPPLEGEFDSDPALEKEEAHSLTREALIEINFRRLSRVLRACRMDRQKLQLWRLWLGVDTWDFHVEAGRDQDLLYTGMGAAFPVIDDQAVYGRDATQQARRKWKESCSPPNVVDVWDVLERRLDRVLLTFEFQGSRASLLRLLLTLHAASHVDHKFPRGWKIEGNDVTVEPDAPVTLSPDAQSQEMSGESRTKLPNWSSEPRGYAPEGWRVARLPRLEFWSDVESCARALNEPSAPYVEGEYTPPLNPSVTSQPQDQAGVSTFDFANTQSPSRISSPVPRALTPQQRGRLFGIFDQPLTGSLAGGPPSRRSSTASPDPSSQLLNARRNSASVRLPPLTSIMKAADATKNNDAAPLSSDSSPPPGPPQLAMSPLFSGADAHDADASFLLDVSRLSPSQRRQLLLETAPQILAPSAHRSESDDPEPIQHPF